MAVMKLAAMVVLICAFVGYWQDQSAQSMIPATVTHHRQKMVTYDDQVDVTCPAGYEGHWVDLNKGFEGDTETAIAFGSAGGGYSRYAYAICFSEKFMNSIRNKPGILRGVPIIRPE
jgi:hypothetical protein